MPQTAVNLVDHFIPRVPMQRWVLPLPVALRLLLASQPDLVTRQQTVVTGAMKRLKRRTLLVKDMGQTYFA